MNKLERQYYEKVNKNINSDIIQKWRTKNQTFLNFLSSLNRNLKILEIGAGRGFITKYMKNKRYDIIGSDFNKKNIELAKKINQIDLMYLDATNIKLKKKFDVIISTDLIEHLEDVPEHIQQVGRILKIGGLYCFTTPNKYLEKFYNKLTNKKNDKFHISLQSIHSLKRTLGDQGFEAKFLHMKEFTLSQKSKIKKLHKLIPIKLLPKTLQPSILCVATYLPNKHKQQVKNVLNAKKSNAN